MFRRDREAQAAAAGMPRRIGLVEALEDVRQPLRRHPGPAVRDRHHQCIGRTLHADLDGRTGGVLARVVEEVAEDPLEAARVSLDDGHVRRDVDGRLRQAGRDDRRHQTPDVDRLEGDLLGARIEPRDLHEVVDEGPQPGDVGDQQLPGPPALLGERSEVVVEDRGLRHERRDGCSQLVRDIGDESAVLRLGGLEAADGLAERLGHPVEPLRPGSELIVRRDRYSRGQVAALDALRGPAGRVDRREDPAGDHAGHDERNEDQRDGPDDEREPELIQRRLEGRRVVDEVHGRDAAPIDPSPNRPPTTRLGWPPIVVQA